MQKGQQSLPEATELGPCPEEDLPAANSSTIQFGCIMILKLIRNQSLRLDKHKYLVDGANISILSDRKLLRKVRVM